MGADQVVAVYRLIPAPARRMLWGRWFPVPTSHLYEPGTGWRAIRGLCADSRPPRPPMP